MKSNDLREVAIFEYDTLRFDPAMFFWTWNKNKNLCGYERKTREHRFTWQPHGSQFTIVEDLPPHCLIIKIRQPPVLEKDKVLVDMDVELYFLSIKNLTIKNIE